MSLSDRTRVERIEAVIKIAERCNINCSYCYMFNKGNDDYRRHPSRINPKMMRAIAQFLARGAADLSAKEVAVIFHGGEPLLIGTNALDAACKAFEEEISPVAKVTFALQTNAMLVDEDWIPVFARHRIGVGVSIDGPREIHDEQRVDHRGRGTYDRTIKGLELLQRAAECDLIGPPGALCVIDPRRDARTIYRHFVDDLGLRNMNFLIPMESHDSFDKNMVPAFTNYVLSLFDEWIRDDDPDIHVRLLEQFIGFLTQGQDGGERVKRRLRSGVCLVTIASNGDVGPDDELKPLNLGQGTANVMSTSLREFWGSALMTYLAEAYESLPGACRQCCWQNYCCGGAVHGVMINRHSKARGFDNPSVLCDSLQAFYARVAGYLLEHGLAIERLGEVLDYDEALHIDPPRPPVSVVTRPPRLLPLASNG